MTLAGASRVGRLVLYHHDPQRDDDGVDDLLRRARALAVAEGFSLDVDAAAEGSVLEVRDVDRIAAARPAHRPRSFPRPLTSRSELPSRPATLSSSRRSRRPQSPKDSRWRLAGDLSDAVVVMDVDDDGGASRSVDRSAGVLGVTRRSVPTLPIAGITDWIVLPASIAHIRTKLRAAVLRKACRWLAAPVAPDEERRLATLHGLGLLDTPREERFDRLVERAREIAATPSP